jgi:ribonuclease HI
LDDLDQSGAKKQVTVKATTVNLAPRWIPPPAGTIKINVDAAVSKGSGCGSIAAVARPEDGLYLGASTVVLAGKTEPETLEVLACKEAIALACDINAASVHVASDCMQEVKSINEGTNGVYTHIVREITAARGNFQKLTFVHERRNQIKKHIILLGV